MCAPTASASGIDKVIQLGQFNINESSRADIDALREMCFAAPEAEPAGEQPAGWAAWFKALLR